jgi:hypothetical protein
MSKTDNWKRTEHYLAKLYIKYGISATRKSRAGDYSEKNFEVHIENHPEFASDAKYSAARPFRHHGLVYECEERYCKDPKIGAEFAVILTKNFKEHGGCISVRDEFFAMLLANWLETGSKEELLKIYRGEK